MKHVLRKKHWLRELAVLATLTSFATVPVQATAPAGAPASAAASAHDSCGQGESTLALKSSSADETEEDSAAAPLQLTPIEDPLKVTADSETPASPAAAGAEAAKEVSSKGATAQEATATEAAAKDASAKETSTKGAAGKRAAAAAADKKATAGKATETDPKDADVDADAAQSNGDNVLRPSAGLIKALPASEDNAELSLEAQQAKDQGECPGGEGSPTAPNHTLNDLPLEQEEHPFDAPAAQSEENRLDPADAAAAERNTGAPEIAPIESAAQQVMRQRINLCLAHYFNHPENLAKRSPWAVMHTILPYGVETDIVAGNRRVNAIGWMCYNGVCKTQRMFHPTHSGFRTNVGPGVQGHEGQFLAILAQSSVPRNFPILVGKTRYTVSDLIRYEMATCREKSELTFKLIGLSHYLSPRQVWRDDRGQLWNLEKVVREEVDQPVVGAACGGTHRLMGLSYALMMRRRYKEPINGHWARADVYLKDFVQYAWSLQNPDGSFSTEWFEGRANEPDAERKVQTTGHILEWLIFTLPAEELDDPRLTKAVDFILSQVYDNREHEWPIGPRGHALRALALYNQRVFGVPTGQLKSHLAQVGLVKELR